MGGWKGVFEDTILSLAGVLWPSYKVCFHGHLWSAAITRHAGYCIDSFACSLLGTEEEAMG